MKCHFLDSLYNVSANNEGGRGQGDIDIYNPNMKWTENDFTDIEQNVYEMVSG